VLEVLHEDSGQREQRQRAGYASASRFSRQEMAAHYLELYASLFNQ
jgi:hypothetical protein